MVGGHRGDLRGYAAQAAALGLGSLVLVQPLLVTTLLFALPLAAWWSGRRLSRADALWALTLSAALALFVVVAEPTAGVDRAAPPRWLPAGVALGAVLCGCLAVAAVRRGAVRAVLLAVATAVLYGVTAALTKGVVSLLDDGPLALVTAWETPALVVAAVAGTVASQSAFQAGGLAASLPIITVGEPFVGVALGAAVLDEQVHVDGAEWLLFPALVVAMTVATGALARSGRPSGGPLRRRVDTPDRAWAPAARPAAAPRGSPRHPRSAARPAAGPRRAVGDDPRQPLRLELLVEHVQRLDLVEGVEQLDRCLRTVGGVNCTSSANSRPTSRSSSTAGPAAARRARARAGEKELGHAVGCVGVAAHEVERVAEQGPYAGTMRRKPPGLPSSSSATHSRNSGFAPVRHVLRQHIVNPRSGALPRHLALIALSCR